MEDLKHLRRLVLTPREHTSMSFYRLSPKVKESWTTQRRQKKSELQIKNTSFLGLKQPHKKMSLKSAPSFRVCLNGHERSHS